MRIRTTNDGLTVKAVAGTYVVMLNMDMAEAKCDGLQGFAVHRTDHTENEAYWLEGMKIFQSIPIDFPPGSKVSTNEHPIQGFTWSDYSAKPGYRYTYRVVSKYGVAGALTDGPAVELEVKTEAEEDGIHDIYFNRGSAASQEYTNRFHNQSPALVGEPAFRWLSRGLDEGILNFINSALDNTWSLRVAAYEFTEDGFLAALQEAARDRKVDVHIIYHARERVSQKTSADGKTTTTQTGYNREAVAKYAIADLCTERLAKPQDISHNKFIVLLKDGQPQAVLTGSTNFSTGGIFGHSNVVHIVQDEIAAKAYLDYWDKLLADPTKTTLGPTLSAETVFPPALPANGTTTVFSPRSEADALDYYARLAGGAQEALFMTFPFGMIQKFQDVYAAGPAGLRFALMDKEVLPRKDKVKEEAERQKIIKLRKMKENRFAIGTDLQLNALDHWLAERRFNMNPNVKYLHTKYMLVDPLSDDPIVVSGSANFSDASCVDNDENMLVIRGDTRVADVYLGEFMRLYSHHAFRDWVKSEIEKGNEVSPVEYLDETNTWWKQWFGDTARSRQRKYFSK
jgi:phosphatidylserine/phosphatidylglycerophosphate/cardiolipin synthase-like enzyme